MCIVSARDRKRQGNNLSQLKKSGGKALREANFLFSRRASYFGRVLCVGAMNFNDSEMARSLAHCVSIGCIAMRLSATAQIAEVCYISSGATSSLPSILLFLSMQPPRELLFSFFLCLRMFAYNSQV